MLHVYIPYKSLLGLAGPVIVLKWDSESAECILLDIN